MQARLKTATGYTWKLSLSLHSFLPTLSSSAASSALPLLSHPPPFACLCCIPGHKRAQGPGLRFRESQCHSSAPAALAQCWRSASAGPFQRHHGQRQGQDDGCHFLVAILISVLEEGWFGSRLLATLSVCVLYHFCPRLSWL